MKVAVFLGFQIAFVCARIRYTYLPNDYVGVFEENVNVTHVNDCATLAMDGQKIGFRFNYKKDFMVCALLKQFTRFVAKTDSDIHDYILDTKVNDSICYADVDRNISDIISGPCAVQGSGCQMLEKIKKFCVLVGTDNAHCVSTKGYTVAHTECPPGEELIALRKETLHCCPRGEELKTVENGKAYCCPANNSKRS